MAITQSDRAKVMALKWSSNTYLFSAGSFTYTPEEDVESWQHSSGVNNFNLNWLHLHFSVFCGYLDQQLNAGSSYTLPDNSTYASAPAVGLVDVLNALNSSNQTDIYFYPILVDGVDQVHTDNYKVVKEVANFDLMKARRAGRFTPYVPVHFKTKEPLQAYPDWANR